MSSFVTKDFLRVGPVLYNQLRLKSKINIARPKPLPREKKTFLAVTKHMEPEDLRLPVEKCLKTQEEPERYWLDALDKIYAAELRQAFQTSKVSAIFSRWTTQHDEVHQAKILFFKANYQLVTRNKYIVKEAIAETEFRSLLPLFEASNSVVFSSELGISNLVSVSKKLTKFQLLCAVVEGRILSVSQLEALAAIQDIETARAGILQILQSGTQNVARSLQSHQNALVQQLNQRVEQLQSS